MVKVLVKSFLMLFLGIIKSKLFYDTEKKTNSILGGKKIP